MSEYFSRRPDSEEKSIDAFTVNWHPYLCYLFPPFSLVPRVLRKIQVDQVEALIVDITTRSQRQTPISRKTVTDGGSIIQEKYGKLRDFESTRNILLGS